MQHRQHRLFEGYSIDNLSTIMRGSSVDACLLGKSFPVVADTANAKGSEWQRRPRGRPRFCDVPQGTA
jgi:hypothetical protein